MVVTFNIISVSLSAFIRCAVATMRRHSGHTADLAATLSGYYHLNDRMRGLMLSETKAQSCQCL